jgi:hypothetical protein
MTEKEREREGERERKEGRERGLKQHCTSGEEENFTTYFEVHLHKYICFVRNLSELYAAMLHLLNKLILLINLNSISF